MTMTIESEVLSAAADDWESLERLYISIRFEFISDGYDPQIPETTCWRERNMDVTLAKIADTAMALVRTGQLQARRESGSFITILSGDDVLRCWFHTTEKGLSALKEIDV